jgi:hypothetical protein
LRGCGGERSDDGDVGEEFGGEMVALKQIFGRVEGDESFAGGVLGEVLGDEDFEWEIKGGGWRGEHERGSRFGIAEDEEFGGRHFEAGLFGFAAVVNESEEGNAFGLEDGAEAFDGLVYGVIAGDGNDSGI